MNGIQFNKQTSSGSKTEVSVTSPLIPLIPPYAWKWKTEAALRKL